MPPQADESPVHLRRDTRLPPGQAAEGGANTLQPGRAMYGGDLDDPMMAMGGEQEMLSASAHADFNKYKAE